MHLCKQEAFLSKYGEAFLFALLNGLMLTGCMVLTLTHLADNKQVRVIYAWEYLMYCIGTAS